MNKNPTNQQCLSLKNTSSKFIYRFFNQIIKKLMWHIPSCVKSTWENDVRRQKLAEFWLQTKHTNIWTLIYLRLPRKPSIFLNSAGRTLISPSAVTHHWKGLNKQTNKMDKNILSVVSAFKYLPISSMQTPVVTLPASFPLNFEVIKISRRNTWRHSCDSYKSHRQKKGCIV